MSVDERFALIQRNTEEIVQEDELRALLGSKESPHAYIGFACTGEMHVGYMIPIRKIVDFLKAGCRFTFLIADLHAYLDDSKTPWALLDARYAYYQATCTAVLKAFGAPLDMVHFVRGTDFELAPEYSKNILLMSGMVTHARVRRAASEVVRFGEEPKLGGFLYPLLQIEDVYALGCNIAFGGIDQRGIYMLGRELAPKMGRDKYVCVFTPLLPGLTGAKMSASDAGSKIGVCDDVSSVERKMQKAYCPAGEAEGNGVLAFIEHVLLPHLSDAGSSFLVSRPEKFGGDVAFSSFDALQTAYIDGALHPADLKTAVARELNALLAVVRAEVDPALAEAAYPA